MPQILGMTKEDLISIKPKSINRLLLEEEIIYIAKTLESYWQYDYEAARQGRVGMHAELKSLRHSDGFFVSRILLQYPRIRLLIANQLVIRFNRFENPRLDWVAGIPDGATELGKDVAKLLGAKNAKIKKESGCIELVSLIGAGETLLLVEDFCTRGTGFREAVLNILAKQPQARIFPCEMVIINRGGLREIVVEGVGSFCIIPAADYRVNDWDPNECPLCQMGSKPIKPKATDENWRLITTSQQ